MRIIVSLIFITALFANAQQGGSIKQKSTGPCTVNAVAGGNLTVNINCPGVASSSLRILNEKLQKQDRDIRNIYAMLRTAEEWRKKYDELVNLLASAGVHSGLSRRADELLKAGQFDEAKKVLDRIIEEDENETDQTADDYYSRGRLDELQFDKTAALNDYERAYHFRPDKFEIAYGEELLSQGEINRAEPLLKAGLLRVQALVDKGQTSYRSGLAESLNDLGSLYDMNNMPQEAEAYYKKALEIHQSLAKAGPKSYEVDLAVTLNNLANVYSDTDRPKEADEMYREALRVYEHLDKLTSNDYRQYLAMILHNLGSLYEDADRYDEAEKSYKRALEIRRLMAKSQPVAFDPDVAQTLNNLGILYMHTDRDEEADNALKQALSIFDTAAKSNPGYRYGVAMVLSNLGELYSEKGETMGFCFDGGTPRLIEPQRLASLKKDCAIRAEFLKQSQTALQQSLDIYQELAKVNHDAYQPNVVGVMRKLIDVDCDTGQGDDCEAGWRKVLEMEQELAKTHPNEQSYQRDVASSLGRLAVIYENRGRTEEAEEAYKQAISLLRSLPVGETVDNRWRLASILESFGQFYERTNRHNLAVEQERKQLEVYTELSKLRPDMYEEQRKSLSQMLAQAK
jgi:tetratricopeptide (TPR) repeat protein